MKKRKRENVLADCFAFRALLLEYFFFSDFAQCFASKPHSRSDDFVWWFFYCFPLYGFAAYSSGKQSSFGADCVGAVCDVTHIFCPSAPDAIFLVYGRVFRTFKGFTCLRTTFDLCHYMHNLSLNLVLTKLYDCLFLSIVELTLFDINFFP